MSCLNVGYTCRCKEYAKVRIPDCSCSGLPEISPLLQVRWKRLVRDEGHNAASHSTNMNRFLQSISAERRWIISGTPTTNLLGLSFGSRSSPGTINEMEMTSPVIQAEFNPFPSSLEPEAPWPSMIEKKVSANRFRAEREDLRKLGVMLSDFLGVLPFANDDTAFSRLVVDGLMVKERPMQASVRVLEQVMSVNMVRHRIRDIENHVRLPPCSEEDVLLDMSEISQMMYNVLLSGVAVNAVDSERVDQVRTTFP